MSERRCPKCGTVYADSARFCPRDGNMLVEAQAKPAPPRPPSDSPSGGGTAVRTPPQAKPGLDRAASLLGEVLDSRYQVQEKLGEGGMSYVYLAREVSTGHDVAIKVLSPKLATDRARWSGCDARPGSPCDSTIRMSAASCASASPRMG